MGWIKIESEDDLPKEKCLMWVLHESGKIEHCMFYSEFFATLILPYINITHYQVINKPYPPTK